MTPQEIQQIQELAAQGVGVRAIARRLGRDVKTIRRVLGRRGPKTPPPSLLEPFKARIQEKVQMGLMVPRILREIRELGYRGSRTLLADHVRSLKGPLKKHRRPFRRFETPPGQEAQVDWSSYRVQIGGHERVAHCFSMILAWSRMLFVGFYRNERLPTLLFAHVEAFESFQGLTQIVIYDNMTTVTLGRRGGKPLWNPAFLQFARHYGFTPRVCRVRDPNRKGKIERPFWYLESDFLRGRTFESWEDLNRQARQWLDTVANARVHQTTKRVVREAYQEEKASLIALPAAAFPAARHEVRKVGTDGYVSIDGSFYPAPAALVGQYVGVRIDPKRVQILDGSGQVAASHAVPDVPCRLPSDWGPPAAGGEPSSPTELERWFLTLFGQAAAFLEGLQGRMKALTPIHLRQLQRLVQMYGPEAVGAALDRALRYRNFNVQAVARILQQAHPDVIETPPVVPLSGGPAVLGALDDLDGGSLKQYSFDSMPPTAAGDTSHEDDSQD